MWTQNKDDLTRRIGTTLTADRVFGSVMSLKECQAALKQFDLYAVVERITLLLHVNARVFMDGDYPEAGRRNHLSAFVRFMFTQEHAQKVASEIAENPKGFRPLSDQALLATLELALSVCSRKEGRRFDADEDRALLTHIILSFQTELFSATFTEKVLSCAQTWADLNEQDFAEFVRNRVAHNTRAYYRHAMGRLFAFCCVPEIGDAVRDRMGLSLDAWFQRTFCISPRSYLQVAFLLTGVGQRLDESKPSTADLFIDPEKLFSTVREPERSNLLSLVALATEDIEQLEPVSVPLVGLSQFLYSATRFVVKPVLDLGPASICVSPLLLMNKFLTGLPHLALESSRRCLGRGLTLSEVKATRAPFGHLFERYVIWLFRQWLATWPRTEVISPYYVRSNGEEKERDLVVIRSDTAFAFEIKGSVGNLKLRQTGDFKEIDRMVKVGVVQVSEAARALLGGTSVRKNGTVIQGIRRVVPCVVTYDTLPLFPPVSDSYENHLENDLQTRLFTEENGIYPLQFLGIEFLEDWEANFDLTPESGAPFGYLEMRSRNPLLRYREIDRECVVGEPQSGTPRPFEALVTASFALLNMEVRKWFAPAAESTSHQN